MQMTTVVAILGVPLLIAVADLMRRRGDIAFHDLLPARTPSAPSPVELRVSEKPAPAKPPVRTSNCAVPSVPLARTVSLTLSKFLPMPLPNARFVPVGRPRSSVDMIAWS